MAPKKAISLLGLEELTNNKNGLGKALVAEAIGVFFINYFGCLSCLKPSPQAISFTVKGGEEAATNPLYNQTFSSSPFELGTQSVVIALSFGFVIFALVQVRSSYQRILYQWFSRSSQIY